MIKETFHERLEFLAQHRVMHFGLITTSKHRESARPFRAKRQYRFPKKREAFLAYRWHRRGVKLQGLIFGRVRRPLRGRWMALRRRSGLGLSSISSGNFFRR